MKHLIRQFLGTALITSTLGLAVHAESTGGGYVDFGKLSPPASGGEFVEVNINSNIISMATRLAKPSQPEITDIVSGLQHIRVNVVGLDDSNRAEIRERVKALRGELESQGWEKVVTAQEKDQDVMVQLKTRGGEAIQGVAVTVFNGDNQAVLVNVVGDIKPEKIAALGERLDIEPLKHLPLLKPKNNEHP